MRFKTLLVGKSKGIISDFFTQMKDNFESMTSSMRYEDLEVHIKYFEPDALIYCMTQETKDDIAVVGSLYPLLKKKNIPLIIIGEEEDCTDFGKMSGKSVDFVLQKPMTMQGMRERLESFLMKKFFQEKKANMPADARERNVSDTMDLLEAVERQMETLENNPVNEDKAETAGMQDSGEKRRIMIIDDSTGMLRAIKMHLGNDYEVATAISGKIALKYLQNKRVDLILLDYEMPEMDGPEVFQRLQENPETADIPVIFLTGINDTAKIQKALSMKPKGYILKPVNRELLLAKICKVLNN